MCVRAWGLIQNVENKASNLCSCSWIFVLPNEHGWTERDAAPYKDEIFEVMLSPFSLYHSTPSATIAFLWAVDMNSAGTALTAPQKLKWVQCFHREQLQLSIEKYCCPNTLHKQIPFSCNCQSTRLVQFAGNFIHTDILSIFTVTVQSPVRGTISKFGSMIRESLTNFTHFSLFPYVSFS
jgi:hypothetical protein